MYTATLYCGTVLSFEAASFLPAPGEIFPCRKHDYCTVEITGRVAVDRPIHVKRRAKPRSEHELIEWLREHRVTSVHALLRQRFTLRMLAAVQADVRVELDHTTGSVRVRAFRRLPSDGESLG